MYDCDALGQVHGCASDMTAGMGVAESMLLC